MVDAGSEPMYAEKIRVPPQGMVHHTSGDAKHIIIKLLIMTKTEIYLRNEFDFWNVHGIMNTLGLLQSRHHVIRTSC